MDSFSNPPLAAGIMAEPVPATRRWPREVIWVTACFLLAVAFLVMAVAILESRARTTVARGLLEAGGPAAASYGMLVQSEIDEQQLVPFILANDSDVIAALSAPPGAKPGALNAARAVLNGKLGILSKGALAEVIYVLDANGICISASNAGQPGSFVGINYAFRPYFTLARQHGDAQYFAVGIKTHLPGLYVAHAVTLQGKFLGVVVDKLDFQGVETDWAQQGEAVLVLNEAGVVILTDIAGWRYHTLGQLPDARRQALRQSGQFGAAPLAPLPFALTPDGRVKLPDGQQFVMVQAAIPSQGWRVVLLERLGAQERAAERQADVSAVMLLAVLIALAYALRARIKSYLNQKARNEAIRQLANTDPLTELPNRRALTASLDRQWAGHAASGGELAAILVDVDHFKLYNDFYGHPAGDECLRSFAKILREVAQRPGDFVARYGGEEFVLLLPHTGLAGARHVAGRILERMREARMPHAAAPGGTVTVSAGVAAIAPRGDCSPASLIAAADAALYEAKKSGRNLVVSAAECDPAAVSGD